MSTSKATRKPATRKSAARKPAQPAPTLYVVSKAGANYVGKLETTTGRSNAASWEAIQQAIAGNKGKADAATLKAAVPLHKDFVAYAIRRGWLVPAS